MSSWLACLQADRLFLPVTLILLAGSYVVAMEVPGIWVVLQLVGSCASTVMVCTVRSVSDLLCVKVGLLMILLCSHVNRLALSFVG
jgi:amino acid permease